jgi:hypothetical protein
VLALIDALGARLVVCEQLDQVLGNRNRVDWMP